MTARFSDRLGITKPTTTLQVGEMNAALQNSIWNVLISSLLQHDGDWVRAVEYIAALHTRLPLDAVPHDNYNRSAQKWVRDYYFKLPWHEVYNLLEFFAVHGYEIKGGFQPDVDSFVEGLNGVLERELAGYRLIQGQIVPISNPAEVQEIEEAVARAGRLGLAGVQAHIVEALRLLGRKPEPDHRNAIQEAISAVESAVKCIAGVTKGELDDGLKELAKKVPIHGALADAFRKLYGYSSDEKGIRHALLEASANVGFDEAKFMVVACSAFANFLISKADAAGLLKP